MQSPSGVKEEEDAGSGMYRHNGGAPRCVYLGEGPTSAIPRPSNHQRTQTEMLRRPTPTQNRGRSTTISSTPYNMSGDHPFSFNSTPHQRHPSSDTVQTRSEKSGSLGHTLKTKASKLLRRNEDRGNLTPLTSMKDWSDEFDEAPYEPASTTDRKILADGMLPLVLYGNLS